MIKSLGKEQTLEASSELTTFIRVQQKEVVEKAKERRRLWYELWTEGGMSQQAIAEYCGVTRQVIYKEIKHYKDKEMGN